MPIDALVRTAHQYMQQLSPFLGAQGRVLYETTRQALTQGLSGFDPRLRHSVAAIDSSTTDVPYLFADLLLRERTGSYGSREVQLMLDRVGDFTTYSPDLFNYYGTFLSVMIDRALQEEGEMTLDTHNRAVVHVPEFWDSRSSYPLEHLDDIEAYNRDHSLIGYLASRLGKGKLTVHGNVGDFFAKENRGADIRLNGECGWRACYAMIAGSVAIHGIAGHGLASGASGGRILVEGAIRSIGGHYTSAYGHEIFLNGGLVPKEMV